MSLQSQFEFCGKPLGPGHPPLIVAEVGFNHNGDVALAEKMIRSAENCGADAVKLQTFVGTKLYAQSFRAPDPDQPDNEIPFHQFWERYELAQEDYVRLFDSAREIGIPLFSTPFDEGSLEQLLNLGMPAIKIASGDLTHHELLKEAGASKVPIVLSTGMATENEIEQSLNVLETAGANRVVLLHCVSNYPATPEEMNLNAIPRLRERFSVPVGLSDHTLTPESATLATALGAVMIEKHFTTDCTLPGPDQSISMDPVGLKALKQSTERAFQILGREEKKPQESEINTKKGARRSVVSLKDIPAGTLIKHSMLACKRPGTGVPSEDAEQLIGQRTLVHIPAETVITWEMIVKP